MRHERRHRKRYEEPGHARFLTFSCYQRLPLFNNDAIKDLFAHHLEQCRQELAFRNIAWVIMPEHIHLLLIPNLPDGPVSAILRALKEPFARQVLTRWRKLDAPIMPRLVDPRGSVRFWQRGGGYDRNVFKDEELFEKIEYMHGNPVSRGLVESPLDWKWSSARWYAGMKDGAVVVDPV